MQLQYHSLGHKTPHLFNELKPPCIHMSVHKVSNCLPLCFSYVPLLKWAQNGTNMTSLPRLPQNICKSRHKRNVGHFQIRNNFADQKLKCWTILHHITAVKTKCAMHFVCNRNYINVRLLVANVVWTMRLQIAQYKSNLLTGTSNNNENTFPTPSPSPSPPTT